MTSRFARSLARLTIITVLAAGLGGCETMADLDPTGLLGDDSAATDMSAASSPDLAAIPSAPPTADDQAAVASSLNAAGTQAQYSADALRAGTESAALPPGAPPTAAQLALVAPPSADAAPSTDAPPSAGAPPSAAPIPVTSAPAQPAPAAPPPPIAVSSAAATPAIAAPAPVQTAALPPAAGAAASPPPGAEPAVPAVPPEGAIRSGTLTAPVLSDAALGFKPSSAPALDPSVSNFVSPPILARYNRTAAVSNSAGSANAAVPVSATGAMIQATSGSGGPAPTAVVMFPGDGTAISAAARTQIRNAAAAFKAAGGTGTVRVVGHASSRTGNMPVQQHLQLIFEKSHRRALAVMQELVRQGVPADHVQVEAVGDSQPIYYESMPRGEEGNRRAEIFVQ